MSHASRAPHPNQMLTVPRPHVAFGTNTIPADLADATYLRCPAHDLQTGRGIADEHLRAALVKLVVDTADALEHSNHIATTQGYLIERDVLDDHTVVVVDPDQRSWRIHRESADPEHRHTAYRLAAGWFANLPARTD